MARGLSNLGERGSPGTAPPKPWITSSVVRGKNPEVDLKLKYQKTLNIAVAASVVLPSEQAWLFLVSACFKRLT